MSEGQDSDFTDQDGDQEDSPVLKELRSQLRAKDKELTKLRSDQAEAEAQAQSARAEAAQETVNALGMEGLVEDVLNWVEGEITPEKVIAALEERSIPLPDGDAVQPTPDPVDETDENPSKIGQKVAAAAAGGAVKTVDERLAEAKSPAEVDAIMEEANLTRSHY
jgi:hypothetical protein